MPVFLLILLVPIISILFLMLFLIILLVPFRPYSPWRIGTIIDKGKVPYSISKIGGIPWLLVNGLPYPGTFDFTNRKQIDLNGAWGFRLDPKKKGNRKKWHKKDNRQKTIRIPSTYNTAESELTDYQGIVWYWKEFDLPDSFDKMKLYRLCFEGILLRGTVWLNGEELGNFEGGYTSLFFNATPHLKQSNLLTVRCSNKLKPDSLPPKIMNRHNPGWHTYGGIYRPVKIEILPREYIVKFHSKLESLPNGEKQLKVFVLTCGGTENTPLVLTLLDTDKKEIRGRLLNQYKETSLQGNAIYLRIVVFPLKEVSLWSPLTPVYYVLKGEFGADRFIQNLGLRTLEVSKDLLLLNGASLFLKGICRHEDHPKAGATQTDDIIQKDLELIKEMGGNYIRLAHYPHDRRVLDSAEKEGLFVSEELPFYQAGIGFLTWLQERNIKKFPFSLAGIRQTGRRKFLIHARRQLIEMIERDRHKPHLLFWSLGNENYTLGNREGKIFSWLRKTAKDFDPDRPITLVEVTYNFDCLDKRKKGWECADILSVNSYYGWYYGKTEHLGKYLDSIRKRWPDKPLILSEFGAGAAPGRTEEDGPWKAERVYFKRTYSEEYQERIIRDYWKTCRERPWIIGFSPWVLNDFYNVWFPSNPIPNYNLKGICSRDRIPKRAWYALKELYTENNSNHSVFMEKKHASKDL